MTQLKQNRTKHIILSKSVTCCIKVKKKQNVNKYIIIIVKMNCILFSSIFLFVSLR